MDRDLGLFIVRVLCNLFGGALNILVLPQTESNEFVNSDTSLFASILHNLFFRFDNLPFHFAK